MGTKKISKKEKPHISEIDPKIIMPDPENVRHESEERIEADESFLRLKESVYTYGVLVPLVIAPYSKSNKEYKYILVDGERRLRAALATNLQKVPVHILDSAEKGNQMLYAFQIHMLRKEWPRPAQARALLKIIKEAHPLVFGDNLIEFIKIFINAFNNHVHAYPGMNPQDKSGENNIDKLLEYNLESILSKNIRIN